MAESQPVNNITDIDIEAAIHHAMTAYPPLMHDRHRVMLTIEDGVVTVSGYVKSAITGNFLLNTLRSVDGVKDVVVEAFYNDDAIRLDVGHAVPPGVMVRMEYGAVILSGNLPDGVEPEGIVKQVGLVPGVHRVLTTFNNA